MQLVFLHLCFLSVMTVFTLETDYPNPPQNLSKLMEKQMDKVRRIFRPKLRRIRAKSH